MANETKLTITIDANGTAAIRVLEQTEKKAASFTQKVKKNWLAISAAAIAAQQIISRAIDFAKLSDKYDQNQRSFRLMVQAMGKDAEREFAKIQEASGNLIDKNALTESANRAISLGISIDKLGNLMQIARAKARDMGITTTQAFSDISTGIGRASPMILDNLGLTIKIGEANQAYAASINKTVEQLTAYDKQQAITNAVIEAGTEAIERQDLSIRTNAERWQAWSAQITNSKIAIGSFINRVAIGMTAVFQFLSAGVLGVGEFIGRAVQTFLSVYLSGISTVLQLANPVLRMLTTAAKITDALKLTEGAADKLRETTAFTKLLAEGFAKESAKVAKSAGESGAAWAAAEELTAKAAENMKLAVASQKELNAAQAAARKPGEPAAFDDTKMQERLELMQEMENRVAEIGLEADELAIFRLDSKHALEIEKLDELNAVKSEMAQAVVLQAMEREALITENQQAELNNRLAAEKNASQAIMSLKFAVANSAVALLSMLGQKSKIAAIAAIALSKGIAIAQTIQFGAAAELRALLELGPIVGAPFVAKIRALTTANVALIAATGLLQAAGAGGGGGLGGAGGGGGGAAAAIPPSVPERIEEDREPRILVQVFNQGSVVTQDDLARDVHDSLLKLRQDGLPSDTSR